MNLDARAGIAVDPARPRQVDRVALPPAQPGEQERTLPVGPGTAPALVDGCDDGGERLVPRRAEDANRLIPQGSPASGIDVPAHVVAVDSRLCELSARGDAVARGGEIVSDLRGQAGGGLHEIEGACRRRPAPFGGRRPWESAAPAVTPGDACSSPGSIIDRYRVDDDAMSVNDPAWGAPGHSSTPRARDAAPVHDMAAPESSPSGRIEP